MSHGVIIKDAVKRYGDFTALKGVNLEIKQGEFFTLLGPSGCGKTTLLRMIAGFNSVDGGEICFDDKVINNLEAHKRDIGMVFQNYAIFPHLTVAENVAYGLKAKKYPKDQIPGKVEEALDLVQIKNLKDRKPNELSGGQQQRVALARAMATGPKILLLDEPLSNLDAGLRVQLREELKELQKKLGITMVFVTHDQEEALSLSDKIVVMEKGVAVQTGTPREIYFSPVSRYVASFVGKANYIEENGRVQIVRPEDVWMEMDPSGDYTVRSASFMGAHTLYELENGSNVIKADLFGREGSLFSVGDRVRAGWGSRKDGPRDCHL